MAREIKHYDDAEKANDKLVYLKPPYVRVTINVTRVEGDEFYPTSPDKPMAVGMESREGEFKDLSAVNRALFELGLNAVEDTTGLDPKIE